MCRTLVAAVVVLLTGLAHAGEPAIKIHVPAEGPATIDVVGLDAAVLDNLAQQQPSPERWAEILPVHLHDADPSRRVALTGTYKVADGVVRFEPKFPLVVGLQYRVAFHQAKAGGPADAKPVTAELTLPRPKLPPAAVEQVYPTADKLPENHLRFYIHFATPMAQGNAYAHVKLLDDKGNAVFSPFLELGEELWDHSGKRFTLLIDPGRIKQGLKPREDLGPVLEAGKTYTFVIAATWEDAQGTPLKQEFRKKFVATEAVEQGIEPKDWKLKPPTAATAEPLTVTFPRPLDHAMLHRAVWVTDSKGRTVEGKVTVADQERRWDFTPTRPWDAGDYQVVIDTTLEDTSGNRVGRPFEVDVLHPIDKEIKTRTVSVPFRVGGSK